MCDDVQISSVSCFEWHLAPMHTITKGLWNENGLPVTVCQFIVFSHC